MKVSCSSISCFKSCRRLYELKYIEGLEPIKKAEALEVGSNYHEKLESLYNSGRFDVDFDKESAMALAYEKYIYPQFSMQAVEEWKEKDFGGHKIVARFDGITSDGRLVEHKTTGAFNLEEYEYDLQWNEQILAYMWLTGAREVIYTVCRKPTIRQKQNETDEEFFNRMCAWYDEDTEDKIRLIELSRTDDEVEEWAQSLKVIAEQMQEAHTRRELNYKNTSYCKAWGRRCEYSSVCLHYDPNTTYAEFTKSERRDTNGN